MIIKIQYYHDTEPTTEFIHEAASYQLQHVDAERHPVFMKQVKNRERGFSFPPDKEIEDMEFQAMHHCSLLSLPEINFQQHPDRAPILLKDCTLWVMNAKGDTIDKVNC